MGASNLTRSFATVVETARLTWREPLEIMAAKGYGRSYGQECRVLARKISGIFSCGLWEALRDRAALPTAALVTDIGNDLLYGVPVDRLFEWVEECLERLASIGTTTIVTQLPTCNFEQLSEARFHFFRTLFFPSCRITLPALRESAEAVNERLAEFAKMPNTSVIPVSSAWYGCDPIHLRRRVWPEAWATLLSAWRADRDTLLAPRSNLWRSAYLAALAPAEESWFGVRRRRDQPCGALSDGTAISLY